MPSALPDLQALRNAVRASQETETFEPQDCGLWDRAYQRFVELAAKAKLWGA